MARHQWQRPKWEIGETVRASMGKPRKDGRGMTYGYRRATIVSMPEGWMQDATARITVKDTGGETQAVHFGHIYADWE